MNSYACPIIVNNEQCPNDVRMTYVLCDINIRMSISRKFRKKCLNAQSLLCRSQRHSHLGLIFYHSIYLLLRCENLVVVQCVRVCSSFSGSGYRHVSISIFEFRHNIHLLFLTHCKNDLSIICLSIGSDKIYVSACA